jgi:hypothetical protein
MEVNEADTVKFIKFARLRRYGDVARMQDQGMPKQITTATME